MAQLQSDVDRPVPGEFDSSDPLHIWLDVAGNPQKRVLHLCKLFVEEVEAKFLDRLEKAEDKARSSLLSGNFVTKAQDATTISVAILGTALGGVALAASAVLSGGGSIVGAVITLIPIGVGIIIKKRRKDRAENVTHVIQAEFIVYLLAVVRDAANELSRIFEYQLSVLKDESEVRILAKCATKLMLDFNDGETFERNTLLRKVLQEGKLNNNKKFKVENGQKWSAMGLFRKPGLRIGNPGNFQFKVRDGCNAEKYGYRSEFLEMETGVDEHENGRVGKFEELCNECSDQECIIGVYFVQSAIDKEYTKTGYNLPEHSNYIPVHILVRCPKVLNSFAENLKVVPLLSKFLKNKFFLPEDHILQPVFRRHSQARVPRLSGADLTGTDLSHAVLKGCSLQECTFNGCCMFFADLSRAKMSGSTFNSTTIVHSNLIESILVCSEWICTSVHYSRVDGADFSHARPSIGGNSFKGTNVSVAKTMGTGPFDLDESPISTCQDLQFDYIERKSIDVEVQGIEKGKPVLLHGAMGTGKTSIAEHFIESNKQRFFIRWFLDVSEAEDIIVASLTNLASRLGVSYDKLFETIEMLAKEKEVIFLLDNSSNLKCSARTRPKWFTEIWNIRKSIHIIVVSEEVCLEPADVKTIAVGEFEEAEAFLQDVHIKNTEDFQNLCKHFDWNILGLTVAKWFMLKHNLSVDKYLAMQYDKKAAINVRVLEGNETLFSRMSACLEDFDETTLRALACIPLISHRMIPEYILLCQFPSGSALENEVKLCQVQDQLGPLLHSTKEYGIRFFSFNRFTKYVIGEMIDKKERESLPYRLAGILARHFSKDNRFSKGNFLQRLMRGHANVFLQQWGDTKDDDALTSVAFARLSELVGFVCTQESPFNEREADDHFERARNLLHDLCRIHASDLQGNGQNSLSENFPKEYGITDNDEVVSERLFTLLSQKSLELSFGDVKELVFLRTIDEQDAALLPEDVRKNQALVKKIQYSDPLSHEDVDFLVSHGVAYSEASYRELFLPELYVSIIYSLGRNYFYKNSTTTCSLIHPPIFYIDLLKLAYCLARKVSQQMKPANAVMHEYLSKTNGLLYLLVNDDCVNEGGECVEKEKEEHCKDLKAAINRYQELINDKRQFFERGMLKKTKHDVYSKLVCHKQILVCVKKLITYDEDREHHIKFGNKIYDELLRLFYTNASRDCERNVLVQQFEYFNEIADFLSSINNGIRLIYIHIISAEFAKEHDFIPQYVVTLVKLADIFSKIGMDNAAWATHVSTGYVSQCNSMESCREIHRREPRIKEKLRNIQLRNCRAIFIRRALLRRRHKQDENPNNDDPIGEPRDNGVNGRSLASCEKRKCILL